MVIFWRGCSARFPAPVLLPGKSHGRRSLVGCSPWGRLESDTTERLHFHFSLSCIGEGNGSVPSWRRNSSVLAWRIPGTGEPGGLPSMGSHRVGHDWSDLAVAAWRREWPSTPAFLPGEFPRQRSLVGYSPWGHKGSEMTDRHEVLQPNNLLKFLWTLILLFLSSPLLLSVFLTKSYRNIEQKWKITSNRDLGLSL